MLTSLLDLLFPRSSLSGEAGEWITDRERSQLASYPIIERKEQLQARGLEFIDCIHAGSAYHNCPLLKKAIHTFKFKRVRSLSKDLGELMLKATPNISDAVLCPVPLHWSRKFARGFNQSQILADIVGEKLDVPVTKLIKRTRPTGHQVGRHRKERLTALKDAFAILPERFPGKVILIDDLSTTGATLDECAKTLKKSGVKQVHGWVIAHG